MGTQRRTGFTIIELLVVITIIVVLLALLMPGLEQAINRAEDAKCAANLHGIGNAQALYLMDHKRTYPQIWWYSQLLGEKPFHDNGSQRPGFQDSSTNRDATHRPLNAYLGITGPNSRAPIAECPRDQGDAWPPERPSAQNCFEEYGTSYIEATTFDPNRKSWFRFRAVYGIEHNASISSMKQNAISRTNNKVIIADWPIYGDRRWDMPGSQWHSDNANGKMLNTLFADFHVEMFTYDTLYNDDREIPPDQPNNADAPASPGFWWW